MASINFVPSFLVSLSIGNHPQVKTLWYLEVWSSSQNLCSVLSEGYFQHCMKCSDQSTYCWPSTVWPRSGSRPSVGQQQWWQPPALTLGCKKTRVSELPGTTALAHLWIYHPGASAHLSESWLQFWGRQQTSSSWPRYSRYSRKCRIPFSSSHNILEL